MRDKYKIYTGKVSEWGLPNGTVLYECDVPDIKIVYNASKCNSINYSKKFFETTACRFKIKSLPKGYGFDADGNIKRGYCIDVSGFNEEKKKRVQDAFFKLGFYWKMEDKNKHRIGSYDILSNVNSIGCFLDHLVCGDGYLSESQKHFLITYDELMKEAGMIEENKHYWNGKETLKEGMIVSVLRLEYECLKIRITDSGKSMILIMNLKDFRAYWENATNIYPVDTRTDEQRAIDNIDVFLSYLNNETIGEYENHKKFGTEAKKLFEAIKDGKIHGLKWEG